MPDKKVTHNVQNLVSVSVAEIENDIEYILFVDNEGLFPMSEYAKLQPIIESIAKLVVVHADAAARKMQEEVLHNVAAHLKEEAANAVYRAKRPTTETLTITDSEVEPHNDW